jgi:DHA1 family multidrug resistance protein-like MFS transporter
MWKRNLYVAWFAQVLSLSGFGFAFPFMPFFIQEIGITDPEELRFWTGVLASAPALSMAVMAPIWGLIADRIGKKIMMLRAMFFGTLIIFALSLAQNVTTVFVLRIAQGLFTGTATASAALIATGTPRDRLGYALGLLSSSNFIGISIGPLLGGIVSEWVGYRASFTVGAAVLAIGFILVLVLIREAPSEDERTVSVAGSTAGTGGEPGKAARVPLRSLFTVTVISALVMMLILRFVRALPIPFLPLYIQELRGTIDGSASATGAIAAARGAVTALAAVTITRLGDRHPKLLVASALLAIAGVFSLPLAFVPTLGWFALLIVIATFFLGGIEPLLQAEISALVPANRRGVLFGVQTTVSNMGWFIAPLVGSWISIEFGLAMVYVALTISLFPASAVALFVHRRASP